jgi:hypothetical protein
MGQQQPKESDAVIGPEKVQKARINAQGNAKWDDLPEVDRTGAKFMNEHDVNPAYAKGGTGKQANPGIPT